MCAFLQCVFHGICDVLLNYQGPVEMANVFLAPVTEGERLTKHHNKLRICFKDFLKKLAQFLIIYLFIYLFIIENHTQGT